MWISLDFGQSHDRRCAWWSWNFYQCLQLWNIKRKTQEKAANDRGVYWKTWRSLLLCQPKGLHRAKKLLWRLLLFLLKWKDKGAFRAFSSGRRASHTYYDQPQRDSNLPNQQQVFPKVISRSFIDSKSEYRSQHCYQLLTIHLLKSFSQRRVEKKKIIVLILACYLWALSISLGCSQEDKSQRVFLASFRRSWQLFSCSHCLQHVSSCLQLD